MARNKELANKLKQALKDAGSPLLGKREEGSGKQVKKAGTVNKAVPAAEARGEPSAGRDAPKEGRLKSGRREGDKAGRSGRRKHRRGGVNDGSPSMAAIRTAWQGGKKKGASNISQDQRPELTTITPIPGVDFMPNQDFWERSGLWKKDLIERGPCRTQLVEDSQTEAYLVIGIDLGTSTTKVVIGDPDRKRFYGVPFWLNDANPYLIPTSLKIDHGERISIASGDIPGAISDIKLKLMTDGGRPSCALVAGYLAQIVRYSISWFLEEFEDVYFDEKLYWTMALGLPADAARQDELEERFRLAAIAGAQVALSDTRYVTRPNVLEMIEQVGGDLVAVNAAAGRLSCFEELGSEEGAVVVVPEIAAQVIGLYRSERWEEKRPISFLVDIGAGTVDAAVFSLVDQGAFDKELSFCAFSCNVSELGALNLHLKRVDWLLRNLPDDLPNRDGVINYLRVLKDFPGASLTVPRGIEDYLNSIVIVDGKDNVLPDLRYKIELGKEVFNRVLMAGKRKNESDSAWRNLRTLICGGGGQSKFYRDFFTGISNGSNTFNLRTEELEPPHNLEVPGLPSYDYHRLSVAYGLAQGTQWAYQWPESIEDIGYRRRDVSDTLVSKDMT